MLILLCERAGDAQAIGLVVVFAVELRSVFSRGLEKGLAKLIVRRLGGEGFGPVGLVLKRFLGHLPFFFFFFNTFACALNPSLHLPGHEFVGRLLSRLLGYASLLFEGFRRLHGRTTLLKKSSS
jgi:hypothetical protein